MEERPLEDILAELLAGGEATGEASTPDVQQADAVGASQPSAAATATASATLKPQQAPAAEPAATCVQQQPEHQHALQQQEDQQQQQQPDAGEIDLELLLGELLPGEQQQQQQQHLSNEAPAGSPKSAAASKSFAAVGLRLPAHPSHAGSSALTDLVDGHSCSTTLAAPSAFAANGPQPSANGAAAAAVPAASDTAADGCDNDPSSNNKSSSSSSAGSDDDSDMLDMLHDMAEVLEVEQPAAQLQPVQGLAGTAAAEEAAAAAAGRSASGSVPAPALQQQQAAVTGSSEVPSVSEMLTPPPAPSSPAAAAAAAAAAGQQGPAGGVLPPHELALQQAWQYEEMLYHGGLAAQQQQQQQQRRAFQRLDPQARLSALLSDAKADWNPAGRPAASGGAMIGGGVLLKLESLAGLFAGAAGGSAGSGSSSGAAGGGAAAGVDWGQVLAAALAPHGPVQVVAASGQYLAVGTASGSALVFQLPQQGSAAAAQQGGGLAGHQNPAGGHGHSALPGGVAMWQLGEGLGVDAVTCLGFSVVAAGCDALWLAVGHGSGALTVWELQRRGPRQVAGIAQHGARISLASFLPSRATSLLLTGDARGRLCLHAFSSLLLRTNVSSKVLANGQYGPLLGISHLAPFTMPAPGAAAAAAGGGSSGGGAGGRGSSWSAGVQGFRGGTPPLSPKGLGPAAGADEAAWRALFEDGTWRVGDGVFCLLTPSHAYIARLKPQAQELLMLFSIPQPTAGPQAAVPTAAWLPHARKASTGYRVWSGGAAEDGSHTVTNGVSNSVSNAGGGGMVVPVAVLALGWGSRLVMFDVPLIGDHVNLGDAGAADAAPSNALAAAAAAAGQLRRGGPGSFSASRAAQRAQQALETLNPSAAAQVAGHFPLSISATWSGSTPAGQAEGSGRGSGSGGGLGANPDAAEPLLGPTEPLPILGVHWLDADAVAVVCQQGFSTLLLVLGFTGSSSSSSSSRHDNKQQQQGAQRVLRVQEQVEWMDQPVDRQWALAGGLAAWGADCCCSVVGGGPRLYLLGQAGGVFCARLMPWSERLKTLQDVRKFKLGLYYALRFHNTIQQQQRSSHSGSEPHGPSGGGSGSAGGLKPRISVGGLGRSEGIGAEPQQLEQWMLSLMLGHASATLQEAAGQQQQQQGQLVPGGAAAAAAAAQPPSDVAAAAEICLCTCLLLGRPDVLFARVYPLFARPPAAAAAAAGPGSGSVAAFMGALEAAVLSDLLLGLDPEVMQALVQHFAAVGQPERVEGCVLHLSIASLDLDQVIRLCEGCGLYSALAYIHNSALADYRKPLTDLLAAVAGAGSAAEARRCCYKLLVYLRCCFRGLAFPPGTGSLPSSPLGVRDTIRATLLGSLLFADAADLLAEWRHSGGRAAAAAAALSAPPAATTSSADASSSTEHSSAGGPVVCRRLSDPHPALQLLLSVDVPAVVAVLAEATAGWDAVETDLRATAGKPASELESVLVATQVVVNALIALLEAGKFEQWQGSSSSSSNQLSGGCVVMNYIADLLAAGRVTVKPTFVLKVLQHIVNQAAAAAAAGDSSHQQAAGARVSQLEQQFISIVEVVGINPPAAAAGQQQQQHIDAAAFTMQQAQAALALATQAGFTRAAAAIHHLAGSYSQAITAYLQLAQQQQQQHEAGAAGPAAEPAAIAAETMAGSRTHGEVFLYIEKFLSSNSSSSSTTTTSSSSSVRKRFVSAVLQHAVQLIQLDPAATAALLLRHQPEQQVPVLVSLQQQPLLQFRFLRAAMQQALLLQRAQQAAAAAAAGELPPSSTAEGAGAATEASSVAAAAAAGAERLLLDRSEVADLYVRLLVQFEPHAVMPFLQSHQHYNVAAAIKACAAGGVSDAEAFLHERLGDLEAALRLHMAAVEASNSRLVAALLSGHIPVLQLPGDLGLGAAEMSRQGSSRGGQVTASLLRQEHCGTGSNGRTSGSSKAEEHAEQVQWGLAALLRQLQAAQDAVQPADSSEAEATRQAAAAAAVAASLLQQLAPASSSSNAHPHQQQYQHQAMQHPYLSSHHSAAGASSSAAALQSAPCCVCVDLHKAWMAELSPRLKLKGLGCTTVHSPLQSASGGVAANSSAASAAAAAAAAAAALAEVPQELAAAWQALQAALAFCKRNTQSSSSSSAAGRSQRHSSSSSSSKQHEADEAGGGKQLWFGLMDVYVARVRSSQAAANSSAPHKQPHPSQHVVSVSQQSSAVAAAVDPRLLESLAAAASRQLPPADLPGVLLAAAAALAGCVAHELFSLLLDEVVAVMADCLPLLDIVARVLTQHGSERFGEFRATLLGLFGATAYESAIMQAANRLITSDAFAAVRRSYLLRQLARQPLTDEEQQQGDGRGLLPSSSSSSSPSAGPSTSAAAAAAAAASTPMPDPPAPDSSSSSAHMVQTALLLGVLGRGSSSSSSSSRGQEQQLRSLTQSDKDLISGILGPGGIKLQLQPAGPAAGHLSGIAAEYRKAAVAAHSSRRVYRGEVDLARELAALNAHSSHSSAARVQQHAGVGAGTDVSSVGSAGSRGCSKGLLQAAGPSSGRQAADAAGANASAAAAADEAVSPSGRGSFDVDELLAWSQDNM